MVLSIAKLSTKLLQPISTSSSHDLPSRTPGAFPPCISARFVSAAVSSAEAVAPGNGATPSRPRAWVPSLRRAVAAPPGSRTSEGGGRSAVPMSRAGKSTTRGVVVEGIFAWGGVDTAWSVRGCFKKPKLSLLVTVRIRPQPLLCVDSKHKASKCRRQGLVVYIFACSLICLLVAVNTQGANLIDSSSLINIVFNMEKFSTTKNIQESLGSSHETCC